MQERLYALYLSVPASNLIIIKVVHFIILQLDFFHLALANVELCHIMY